jgi:hypothetical protein
MGTATHMSPSAAPPRPKVSTPMTLRSSKTNYWLSPKGVPGDLPGGFRANSYDSDSRSFCRAAVSECDQMVRSG